MYKEALFLTYYSHWDFLLPSGVVVILVVEKVEEWRAWKEDLSRL